MLLHLRSPEPWYIIQYEYNGDTNTRIPYIVKYKDMTQSRYVNTHILTQSHPHLCRHNIHVFELHSTHNLACIHA
jgi:hypothetical protein